MKKLLIISLAAILALAGCSGGNEGDEVVTIWAWDAYYNVPAMQYAAEIYNETNPDVKIEVVDIAKEEIEQTLHTALSTGTVDGLPDIVLIEDYNSTLYLESYPDAFYNMNEATNWDDFLPYKVEACTYEDQVYCMPFDTGVTGMFYRTDILEEAGYSAEDVTDITWERYFEIAEDVYEKTGTKMMTSDPADGGYRRIMLQSAGTWYYDGDITTLSDNQTLIEALEVNKTIQNAEWTKSIADWNSFVAAPNTGEVAAVVTGDWFLNSIRAAEDQSGLWAVTTTPSLSADGATNYSNLGGCSFYIVNGTGDEDLAADFLATSMTDMRFYDSALVNQGAIGSYMPSYESEAYATEDEFFGNQKVMSDFAEWSKDIPAVNYGIDSYEVDNAIIGGFTSFLNGEITAEELLTQVEEQLA